MKEPFPPSTAQIMKALEDKKALDIQVLDVRGIVSYTDFMILCSGTSPTHVHALVSAVKEVFPKGEGPVYVNPSKNDTWWILDFVETVVHVFQEETRAFYDLEGLWSDAKRFEMTPSKQ